MKLQTQFSLAFIPILLISGFTLTWLAQRAIHRVIIDEVTGAGRAELQEAASKAVSAFELGSEEKLLPILASVMNHAGAAYAIALDPRGRVLAHTNVVEKGKRYSDALTLGAIHSQVPIVREFYQGSQKFIDISCPIWGHEHSAEPGEELLFSQFQNTRKPIRRGTLRLGLSLERPAITERKISKQLVLLLLCAGGLLLGLDLLLVRGILTPIDRLVQATEQVAAGTYGATLPIPAAKELGELAMSFNRMNLALAQTTVSKEFLDSILSNMLEPLIVLHPDRMIRLINQAVLDIFGFAPGELLDQPVEPLWDGSQALLDTIVREGSVKDCELQFRTKSGNSVAVLFSGSKLTSKEGTLLGFILVAKDIRERKKLEKEMAQSEKLSAVGRLASGVAHEINNPLGAILGFAQSALWDVKPGDPFEFPLKSIERESIRCKNLVQELLTFSRVSKTEREPMDLNQAIEGAFSLIQARARLGKFTLEKALAARLPHILGNVNQIQQIVINLANNALDAMKDQGALTLKTEWMEEGPRGWVVLSVIDNGPGIPDDVLPRIFEPFFTTKPIGQGTGLGLGLVHEIVQKHSAMIEVQTKPGQTEFRVKFPSTESGSIPL